MSMRLSRQKHGQMMTPQISSGEAEEDEALEGLVLKFWPLLFARAVPELGVAGDAEGIARAEAIVRRYADEHPVVAMSRDPDEWMHAPLDVADAIVLR